jgi:23S rRNA pseudouridine955/2504/2580 synthase
METIYYNSTKNIRIDEFIKKTFPDLSINILYKTFRKKDIKVNGKRINNNFPIKNGDKVDIYIDKKYLYNLKNNELEIVYEDENILITNKPQGISVQGTENISLIKLVNSHYKNIPNVEPRLCHRIDRNTGGLVIISKNKTIHNAILNEFGYIKKFYICYVNGIIEKPYEELKAYLIKDSKTSKVSIFNEYIKNSKKIITIYKLISAKNNISKLEIYLKTGRTHQIRAHLAHIGYPLIGDGKYGLNKINKEYSLKYQTLWAYKFNFCFPENSKLSYLNNKKIEIAPPNKFKKMFGF